MAFFDSFFGKSQARDLRASNQQANEALSAGRAGARTEITGGRDRALGVLNPFMQQGQAGSRMYGDALGLNGQQAQQSAFGTYSQNPFLAAQQGESENQLTRMFRKYNAQGMGNSGMSRLATARAAQGFEQQNQTDWLNRLSGVGQQGAQFANTAAGLESGIGQYLADLESGYGQQRAANSINYGNALAATRGIGVNNLINLAGTVARAATGMPSFGGGGAVPQPGQNGYTAPSSYISRDGRLLGGV